MRPLLFFVLALMIPLNSIKLRPVPQMDSSAHAAIPFIMAAPTVAIGSLEVLLVSVTAAASLGIISGVVANQYRSEINYRIDKIKNASSEAWDVMKYETMDLYNEVSQAIGDAGTITCEPPALIKKKVGKDVNTKVEPQVKAKDQTCTQSPKECCKQMMEKFSSNFDRKEAKINQRAYKIWKGTKTNKRPDCCLEWDNLHGAWEVFNASGKHMGERGCDDLNDDPCAPSTGRGAHAAADPAGHRPWDCAELKSGK